VGHTPRGSARNICRRFCRVNPENAPKTAFATAVWQSGRPPEYGSGSAQ